MTLQLFMCLLLTLASNVELRGSSPSQLCQCGKTGNYFRPRHSFMMHGRRATCDTYKNCQNCADGFDFCLGCPPGRAGHYCTEKIASSFFGFPSHISQIYEHSVPKARPQRDTGSRCQNLRPPEQGSVSCWHSHMSGECTAKCLPGYTFENGQGRELLFRCQHGRWSPFSSFPRCTSDGTCDLEMNGAGYYNCTTDVRGRVCQITCDGEQTRHRCNVGVPWNPSLPSCVLPKDEASRAPDFLDSPAPIRCRCQNGGVCNAGRCECPPTFFGNMCERADPESIAQPERVPVPDGRSVCPDPGFVENSDRLNADGTDANTRKSSFPVDFTLLYGCRDTFVIEGLGLITCQSSGQWSSDLPQCLPE